MWSSLLGRTTSRVALLAVAASAATACARTPLDAADPEFARGVASFEAGRWRESRDSLKAFYKASCEPPATSRAGCEKAVWLIVRGDLSAKLPALALEDSLDVGGPSPPGPSLSPSLAQLRQRARDEVSASWMSRDRSSRILLVHNDDAFGALHPIAVTYWIDGVKQLPVPAERWIADMPFADLPAPAGAHYVELEAVYARGSYMVVLHAAKAFATWPQEAVAIVARVENETGVSSSVERTPVIDFDVLAQRQPRRLPSASR